jgi:hypothetical protein
MVTAKTNDDDEETQDKALVVFFKIIGIRFGELQNLSSLLLSDLKTWQLSKDFPKMSGTGKVKFTNRRNELVKNMIEKIN